jgi:Dolichyl-phosphate-mannose-protein mannosyltransferase
VGLAGLAVCAAAAWLPALFASFVADDFLVLDASSRFRGVGWAFRHNTGEIGGGGHFYRPLWVSLQAGLYDLFGGHAAAWHAVNLVLFAAIVVEVWALARALLGEPRAWIAAAAFAVYPRHGESVAWMTGSTDLVAVALALGVLLWALYVRPEWAQAVGAAALAAAAVLSKEIAFVVPVLVLITLRRRRLLVFGATAGAQLAVLIARTVVLHGAGGYSQYPWHPGRLLVVAVSYVLAAFSPPQLELTRYPELVVVPLILLALFLWALRRAARPAWIGVAWFAVALIPGANVAVDLNNSLGERLLFLPSVGLAIAFAAIVPWRRIWPLAAAGVVALALSVLAASDWITAGRIAHRTVAEAARLGPHGGELMLLTAPEAYRSASVLPTSNTLDAALARAGRSDVHTAFCSHVYIRRQHARSIRITQAGTNFHARSTWSAPFDVPVTRRAAQALDLGCSYARDDGSRWPLGLTRKVRIAAAPPAGSVLAYFDGRDLRRFG